MQAQLIRDKYKRILEQPEEEEDSEDQWETAYSQMNKHRKRKILTEASQHNTTNGQISQNGQGMLNMKQKLAQCLSNCKDHCREIQRLKKETMLFDEERKNWMGDQNQLNRAIEEERDNVRDRDQKLRALEGEHQDLMAKCQQLMVEKELQQKQAEFYKAELGQLKVDLERKERQFKHCENDFKSFERLRRDNEYLKADVERLSFLIEDSTRFGRVSSELMKKHFLGKPYREIEMWCSQNLVGEVQHFIKKSQVGHGNREFTSNLIKFVDKIVEKTRQQGRSKTSQSCYKTKEKQSFSLKKPSKLHQRDQTKKASCTVSSLRDDNTISNTRALTNSFWRINDSRLTSGLSVNLNLSLATIKSQCWDVVNGFRQIVFDLLLQKDIKKKKIKKLVDSMSSSLMDLFDCHTHGREFSFSQDNRQDFKDMRLVTEDITTGFK